MAYLGRRGALAPLTSADIPVGIVEGTDVAFLENASGTQNLTGTYSTERMYLNDSYTLTGDVTVTGHLALGSIADEDIIITNDGTERTITTDASGGTLEAGNVLQDTHRTSVTGMTGELGSVVTGSPNLNLTTGTLGSGVTFPAGHIIQTRTDTVTGYYTFGNNTPTAISGFSVAMPVRSASSKILIFLSLSGAGKSVSDTALGVRLTESATSLDVILQDLIGYNNSTAHNTSSASSIYEHTHGQSVGTTLTYTPKFYSAANSNGTEVGNYYNGNTRLQTITIFEVMQ
jgi:hypothetical protein